MASAPEHAKNVLAGIIPNRKDRLDRATRQLTPAHFPERVQSTMFMMFMRYAEVAGGVMPEKYLDDLLRKRGDDDQKLLFVEAYQLYEETTVSEEEFSWSLLQLREIAAEKATADVLTRSMEILRSGAEIEGEELRGHEAARGFLLENFASIDRELTMQDAPEGALQDEADEMMADYNERKEARLSGSLKGVGFGIDVLDNLTGGMQRGELILLAGYSSDGKTTLVTQAAWSAAVEQGKNVVFLTTETIRTQVRRKLIARHSMLPQFDLPEGINTNDLKNGTLPSHLEPKLQSVITDLAKNPKYGKLYLAQVPRSSSIASLEQRLYRIQRSFDIDLVVMDYLALLVPPRGRTTSREELSGIMKEAKQVATTFNNGLGIPLLSPWQVNRAGREKAEQLGMYTSAALSETAESTNSADMIVSILAPTDNTNRRADVTLQVLKNRDGEKANSLTVEVDYATSSFRSRGLFASATTSAHGSTGGAFDGLLDNIN